MQSGGFGTPKDFFGIFGTRPFPYCLDHKLTFDRLREVHHGFIHETYHKSIIDGHYVYHSEETEMLTIPSP